MQTFSDDKNTYSVDAMFIYLANSEHPMCSLKIADLIHTMDFKCWGDETCTPKQLLVNPLFDIKHWIRIIRADLSYPIIVVGNYIIDGMHRLSKAIMNNDIDINAYMFDEELLNTFIID